MPLRLRECHQKRSVASARRQRPELWLLAAGARERRESDPRPNRQGEDERRIHRLDQHESPVRRFESIRLRLLRWTRDRRVPPVALFVRTIPCRYGSPPVARTQPRSNRYQPWLRTVELPMGHENPAGSQHADEPHHHRARRESERFGMGRATQHLVGSDLRQTQGRLVGRTSHRHTSPPVASQALVAGGSCSRHPPLEPRQDLIGQIHAFQRPRA